MVITIDDIRVSHCARGARRWFEAYGLDFRGFLKSGIDVADFLATRDGLACQVVARTLMRRFPDHTDAVAAADGNVEALIALATELEPSNG